MLCMSAPSEVSVDLHRGLVAVCLAMLCFGSSPLETRKHTGCNVHQGQSCRQRAWNAASRTSNNAMHGAQSYVTSRGMCLSTPIRVQNQDCRHCFVFGTSYSGGQHLVDNSLMCNLEAWQVFKCAYWHSHLLYHQGFPSLACQR